MIAQSTFLIFQRWGDDDETVQIAIESCPVDCIHYMPACHLTFSMSYYAFLSLCSWVYYVDEHTCIGCNRLSLWMMNMAVPECFNNGETITKQSKARLKLTSGLYSLHTV
jgi:hypothetical protein